MFYLFMFLMSAVFVEGVIRFKVISAASSIVKQSMNSIQVLMDDQIDDLKKEQLARRASIDMLKETFYFLILLTILIAAVILFSGLFILVFPSYEERALEMTTSITDLIFLTVSALIYVWGRNVVQGRL